MLVKRQLHGVDSSFPLNPCRIDVINRFSGGLSCISCCHSKSLPFLHFCDAIVLQTADSLLDWSKFHGMKLSQIAADPQKLENFNPTKGKAYTVYLVLLLG